MLSIFRFTLRSDRQGGFLLLLLLLNVELAFGTFKVTMDYKYAAFFAVLHNIVM